MAYEYSYIFEDILGTGVLSALVSGIPSGLFGIVTYVLSSLGLYTLAQRRGLNRPWLAWIPVVNCWILGSLSDQYRYVVKGEVKSKRKVLLILQILTTVMGIAMAVVAVVMAVNVAGGVMRGADEGRIMEMVLGPLVGILGMCLPLAGIAIAYAVVRYMALYDVYRSMDPVNCVLFTVLSILVGVTEPFFLFFNREKDLGMPPRRQEYAPPQQQYVPPQPEYVPPQPEYQPTEPVKEFWEQDNIDYL